MELELGSVVAAPGTLLVRQGEAASEVFLVTRGTLTVVRDGPDGRSLRLTTLSADGTFSELAFVDRGVRAADVRADSEVAQNAPLRSHRRARRKRSGAPRKLLRNLLGVVSATLHGVNAEIAHLTR